MSEVVAVKSKRLVIEFDTDAVVATIKVRKTEDDEPITKEDITEAVNKAEIDITDSVRERIKEYANLLKDSDLPPESYIIAEGTAPVYGEDGKLVWNEEYKAQAAEWDEEGTVNYYNVSSIVTVKKGTVIGKVLPPVSAVDGVNVKGQKVPSRGSSIALELDETIGRSPDDPSMVVALIDGRVRENQHLLKIEEVLHIPGNVSFETGNITSTVDVNINGKIGDRFEVKAKKSITVGMSIEAARVTAGEDVTVRRGIVARHGGLVTAVRDIVTKHAAEANLVAYRDIKIAKQLMNCQTCVNHNLIGPHAKIIGGCVFAGESVLADTLGSGANVRTRIVVGANPEVVRKMAVVQKRINTNKELVKRIREVIKPLTDGTQKLNAEQKEKVDSISERMEQAKKQTAADQKIYAELSEKVMAEGQPRVEVNRTIFPKVSIRIGDKEVHFEKEFKGPIIIEKRKMDRVTEVVAVNKLTASIITLKSQKCSVDELLEGFELEQEIQD